MKPYALEAAAEFVRLTRLTGRDRTMPAKMYAAMLIQRYLATDKKFKQRLSR